FNSAQFDLSFNSSVVNVTDVREGEIDGEAVHVFNWGFVDADTVRVLASLPMGVGVNGSGYLAEVVFGVNGKSGDKSELDISGLLVDTEAKEIEAEWYGDEVTVLRPVVSVDAPEYVSGTFNATIGLDNVTDLNSAQFDLSFNSSVVNVTDVREGEIDGEAVPVFNWGFVDADTVRVLASLPMGVGVNGSGYLAEVVFGVNGKSGDKSELDISGLLVDTEAKEIEAEWYGDEVRIEE
ncbi:MAG: cohesin domain-containing protein, partial [Methanophagales archaeon]|nr:cohesin domain-containing protein [Methanophagales archaeon]